MQRIAIKKGDHRAHGTVIAIFLTTVFLSGCLDLDSSKQQAILAHQNPVVRLNTELGDIDIELFVNQAPITTANFLAYVDAGLYASDDSNHASFYRTVRGDNQAQNSEKIMVIQGGLMGDQMSGNSDVGINALPPIEHEPTVQTQIKHTDGIVSLARLEPGTGSSEFFITIGNQPSLDFGGKRNPDGQGFAAFGKVVAGMEIVNKIHQAQTIAPQGETLSYTSGQILKNPIRIFASKRINDPSN